MADGKRGSSDGVEVEDIKVMDQHALNSLASLFTKYCSPSSPPNHWMVTTTRLIPKKEGASKATELRTIACHSHLYKLLLRVILARIQHKFVARPWTFGCKGGPGSEKLALSIA